ncbi:Hpt domain-containing protein [Lawsonibacter sp. OA9]|uniref:Hpt domain-containing protein n=1 Tax=Oscillospiraceae TaxID=216572 RepID=UPI001F051346|nr:MULTISPECIES: Hpt domain-containing protein [Oscillospiraceae]MCH1980924.1 Hpt domain-containing protein [Lawsonibacter sp. OA9]MCH1984218.1 Hpt domain-containing protein [Ruminococcus sp. OA3]
MDQNSRTILQIAGIDYDAAVARFSGNSGLYIRFLHKFLQDENMQLFSCAMKEERYDDALLAAHTLKGVAGNLGLTRLFDLCSQIVVELRSDNAAQAQDLFPAAKEAYDAAVAAISSTMEI